LPSFVSQLSSNALLDSGVGVDFFICGALFEKLKIMKEQLLLFFFHNKIDKNYERAARSLSLC